MFSRKPTNFQKNLGITTSASVITFLISFALTPVMTRWYQPDDYGTFALINNIATFVATAFLLSLPNALPMESSWHRRAQLLRALTHLTALAVLLSSVAVGSFLGFKYIFNKMNGGELAFTSIPFLVLAIALHRIAQGWAVADGDFRLMATARIIHPLTSKPLAIVASILTTSNPLYIVFFEAAGYFLQTFTITRKKIRPLAVFSNFFSLRRFGVTVGTIRRHYDYSLFYNLTTLLMLGSLTLQTAILATNYSVSETGIFSLAMSMVSMPVQLVALATASIIYHQLIQITRNAPHKLFAKTRTIILIYAVLGAIPYILICIFGPELFGFVFGDEWKQSGDVASLLSVPLFLQFVLMPTLSVFRVTQNLKLQFMIDLFFLMPITLIFYLVSRSMPFLNAVTLLAIAMSIYRIVVIGFCLSVTWHASQVALNSQGK